MAKVDLIDIASLQNETSAVSAINTNSSRIEVAMENTLSRDGSTPNEMNTDLDMNNHRIYNLPEAVSDTEPFRKAEAEEILTLAGEFEEVLEATEGVLDAYDSLQALYLGEKTFFPSVDNTGEPLQNGALVSIVDQPDPLDDGMYVYHNGAWDPVGTLPLAFVRKEYFFATAGQTTFTISGGYIPGQILIYRNGALQLIGTPSSVGDTSFDVEASDGTSIVFPPAVLKENDFIYVWMLTPFVSGNQSASTVDISPIAGLSAANTQQALEELNSDFRVSPSVDNAVPRFDGVTGNLQSSSLVVDDTTGALSNVAGNGIPVQASNTNTNPAAGAVGQRISLEVADPGTTLTTAQVASLGSINLAAGNWLVWGLICYKVLVGTTPSSVQGGLNTSAALPTPPNGGAYMSDGGPHSAAANQLRPIGQRVYSLASATDIHLVAYATFSGGSGMSAYGGIYAIRLP